MSEARSESTVDELLNLPPAAIEIQPTAICHRKCSFCSHIVRNRHGGTLSEEKVEECARIAEGFGVERITFSGGGEPLMWEPLPAAIKRAQAFAEVTLTTSGDQFLDRERGSLSPLAGSCLAYVDALVINVPAVDEESIRRQIAGGPSWAQLKHLLQLLVERSKSPDGPSFRVTCAVVISQANIEDLPRIDRVLHDIGVDQVYFKEYKLFGLDAARRPRARIDLRALDVAAWGSSGSDDLARFAASLSTPRVATGVPCWANRSGFTAIIDPNGDVFLCTPTVGDADYVIGNVWDEPFHAIWNGPKRREMVEALSSRSESGGCPIECRYHAHNRMFDEARNRGAPVSVPVPWVSNSGLDDL